MASRSVPKTLTPTGVRTPVVSMSTRVLIGIVQALVQPGNCMRAFISAVSSSQLIGCCSGQSARNGAFIHPGAHDEYHRAWNVFRHAPGGFSRTVVSTIVIGAGSVAVSARPTLPNTV